MGYNSNFSLNIKKKKRTYIGVKVFDGEGIQATECEGGKEN